MFFLPFPHGALDVDSLLDPKDVIHLKDISQGYLGPARLEVKGMNRSILVEVVIPALQ